MPGTARQRLTVLAVAALVVLVATVVLTSREDEPESLGTAGTTTVTSARPPATTLPATTLAPGPAVPTTTAVPPTTAPAALPAECSTAGASVAQQARSLVFATVGRSAEELRWAIASGVGGIFISSAAVPLVAGGDLRAALAGPELDPLVAIDEEGGRVQRLRAVLGPLPSARELASRSADDVRALARSHGEAMLELGLNMDFAPVVDVVDDAGDGRGIGDRSPSGDPAVVTATAGAFAEGLLEAGLLPTFKHFPGHGHASGDSHDGLVTTPPLAELRTDDLLPYVDLLPRVEAAVMVGHLDVPGLTDGQPASLSPAAVALLRDDLGFDGLVVTDDLGAMQAILDSYTPVAAAVLAVAAGVDMVLVPVALADEVATAIEAAVADGRIAPAQLTASADRVARARNRTLCPQDG